LCLLKFIWKRTFMWEMKKNETEVADKIRAEYFKGLLGKVRNKVTAHAYVAWCSDGSFGLRSRTLGCDIHNMLYDMTRLNTAYVVVKRGALILLYSPAVFPVSLHFPPNKWQASENESLCWRLINENGLNKDMSMGPGRGAGRQTSHLTPLVDIWKDWNWRKERDIRKITNLQN
jgi:hypothetical protein